MAKPKSLRKPSGRGPGKPKGALGGALLQVEVPDDTRVHVPSACASCAADLVTAEVVSVEKRQVFDLPEIRLRVTEPHIEHRRCGCGAVTAASAPEGAAPAQYGPHLKAFAVYLLTRQHLPYERCTELLTDVLGADLATATLHTWTAQAAEAVATHTEAVRQQLIECDVVGFDETSTRVEGRTCWVHTACTRTLTFYHVHAKRGVDAFKVMGVPPAFTADHRPRRLEAVQDLHRRRPRPMKCPLCRYRHNGHFIRHLKGTLALQERLEQGWAKKVIEVLRAANAAVQDALAKGLDALEPDLLAGLRAQYDMRVAIGVSINEERPWHDGRHPGYRIAKRLRDKAEQVWLFTRDFRVPWTNNPSEQALPAIEAGKRWGAVRCPTQPIALLALSVVRGQGHSRWPAASSRST